MTYAFYGPYAHEANEVYVQSATLQANLTDRGWVRSRTGTLTIGGFKKGTPAEIAAAVNLMQQAYLPSGYDFRLISDTGVLLFSLLSTGAYGGVVPVAPVIFGQLDGAAFATRLDYSITLTAEYPTIESFVGANIVQYEEQLTFAGGIPIRVVRACVNSDPVEQELSPRSPYQATQAGTLITLTSNPRENPPLWPDKLIGDPQVTQITPDVMRGGFVQQGVSWVYQYASASQLVGQSVVR